MAKELKQRDVYVYAHWQGMGQPQLMGVLGAGLLRGKEVFHFEYTPNWLTSKYAMQLDPDLSLYPGKHFPADDKPNFGLFLDSSPDRWGQVLMRRREAAADLEELWRRIVFSICVSNTDDHLRNHGFILTGNGWVLSPAYDINPNETGSGLSLNISENDNELNLDLAMEVHEYFRLKKRQALGIIEKTKKAVSTWRAVAKRIGIPNAEQELKTSAFSRAG